MGRSWVWLLALSMASAAYSQDIPTTLPVVPPSNGARLSQQVAIRVKSFRFRGNTVFTDAQLAAIAEPFRAKHNGLMTSQDLESVRTALTLAYVNKGYINSGAILPDQNVTDGIIQFDIVEGKLVKTIVHHGPAGMSMAAPPTTQPAKFPPAHAGLQNKATPLFSVTGNGWHLLQDSYLIDRVKLGAGPPLNVLQLKDELELLRRDPNIATINAELAPGDSPGESVLDLTTTERNPFQLGIDFSNDRPPSVGAYEFDVLASDSDLTGDGDALSARWGVLAGAANSLEFDQDNDLSFDYLRPLLPGGPTLEANYTRSSDVVVEEPFAPADITSRTDSLYFTLRQPVIKTVEDPELHTKDQELAALFTVSSRYNRTFLLGEPFSFSDGVENGEQGIFALRPALEYLRRSAEDALAIRTTFSIGTDGPKATVHSNGTPDSRFFAFLGQAQYVHRFPLGNPDLPWNDTQGVLRLNTQLTPNRLLTLEQFSLGGENTVRGYEVNQFVTDEAVQGSAELQVPVLKANSQDQLAVTPFYDAGYAWNRKNSTQTPTFIDSIGIGLAFTPDERIRASIDYGYRLKQISHNEDDLQDMGIEFDVTILAF